MSFVDNALDFCFDHPLLTMGTITIGFLALLAHYATKQEAERHACLEAGHSWEVVDKTTTYIKSGQVLVPVPAYIYGCVEVSRD